MQFLVLHDFWVVRSVFRGCVGYCLPAVGCGVSGAGCGFRVGWRTAWGVLSLFFGAFLLVLAGFSFWRGEWALGYPFLEFRHFPNIS